jgi:hypothetical protein
MDALLERYKAAERQLLETHASDSTDFTNRYNTPLSAPEEQQFQVWIGHLSAAKGYNAQMDLRDYDLRGAFKAGVTADARGHLTDEWKKPNHPTFSDESIYNGKDGNEGGKWIQAPNGQWAYKASTTNLKFRSPDALRQYFQRVEPNSKLMLP